MGNSTCIGRVGGLAVALGVGVAIAAAPGLAWAEPSDQSSTSNSSEDSAGAGRAFDHKDTADKPARTSKIGTERDAGSDAEPAGPPANDPKEPSDADATPDSGKRQGIGDRRTAAEGQSTVPTDTEQDPADDAPPGSKTSDKSRENSNRVVPAAVTAPTRAAVKVRAEQSVSTHPEPAPIIKAMPTAPQSKPVVSERVSTPKVVPHTASPAQPATPTTLISVPVRPARTDVPVPPVSPVEPVEPALGFLMLVAARKQSGRTAIEATGDLAGSVTPTSQTVEPLALAQATAVNSAPVLPYAQPVGRHDASGLVIGTVVADDPDGDPRTFQLVSQPAHGTVALHATTGAYTYTPTQARRLDAYWTSNVDTDTFTVSVSDGQQTVTTPVQVNIKPGRYENQSSIAVGTNPSAVATDGTRMYVVNTSNNSVSVVNAVTGQRIDANPSSSSSMDISVGSSPSALALSADGRALFVANTAGNSVSVIRIDTVANTYTRVDASPGSSSMDISVGSAPSALALSSDGTRLYVANRSSNSVSVININVGANTYTRVDANPGSSSSMDISVGSAPSALALSSDGTRLYVANSSSQSVSMIRVTSGWQRTDMTVGSAPSGLALSTPVAGTQMLYVTNRLSNSMSVMRVSPNTFQRIDAYPGATSNDIAVGPAPSSVAVSPDGSLAYVANGDDTVTIVVTKNYTVHATVTIDTAAESTGGHSTAMSPDGVHLYVSDAVDRTVRVLDLITVNTAPTVPGDSIPSAPDPVSGVVTGRINVLDADDDRLMYTLAQTPAGGTVTVNSQTGVFTFTPNQAARNQAAATPSFDFDSFGVSISDGATATQTVVDVQVAPSVTQTSATTVPIAVGSGPSGSVVSGSHTYVINYDSNNVTVIDTVTNEVVKTLPAGVGPLSVTATPTRVYVSNSLSNSVSVINSTNSSLIGAPIQIPVQKGLYENPEWGSEEYDNRITEVAASGNRLYVNATDGNIYVFDTTDDRNTLIRTAPMGTFADLELNTTGKQLYGTNGGGLTVIDTTTWTAVAVPVGPRWDPNAERTEYTNSVGNVSLSPDGKRAYVTYGATIVETGVGGQTNGSFIFAYGRNWMVTGGYGAVSVIDTQVGSATYNKEIARVVVPLGVHDVAVSKDSKQLFITSGDGKSVTVMNTATNRVVGSFATDQTSSGGRAIDYYLYDWFYIYSVPVFTRYITVDPVSGKVFVTDYTDGSVYAVTPGATVL